MARTARKHSDSGVYHVILRGVNKQQIFECTEDYQRFLNILRTLTVREQDESGHRSKYGRIGHLHIPSCKGQQVRKWEKTPVGNGMWIYPWRRRLVFLLLTWWIRVLPGVLISLRPNESGTCPMTLIYVAAALPYHKAAWKTCQTIIS